MCFFNRGDTEGTNSSKVLCLMFVYVLFYVDVVSGLILGFVVCLFFLLRNCGLKTCVHSK